MRFARWIFAAAAVYGLPATLALYVRAPLTADTIWLFAFAGAAAATQLLYVALAVDPRRFRALIPVGIVSKLSFAAPVSVLYARGAIDAGLFAAGLIDFVLAALFAICWWRLGHGELP